MLEINDEEARRLAGEVAKLAKEAARLRSDVRRVARVFFPTLDLEAEDVWPGSSITAPVKSAKDLMGRLALHRRSLEDSQGYVLQIEALLKTIRDDLPSSRAEWEPFLTKLSPRGGGQRGGR